MGAKGLELIAVNNDDPRAVPNALISHYITANKFTFSVALDRGKGKDEVAEQFGVQSYPTTYLLDSTGKVVFRSVGFDEVGIRAALKKLGLL